MKFSISGRHTSNYDSHDRSDEANCGDGAHTLFVTFFWNCQLFYNVIVVIRRRIIVPVIICLLMISEPHRPCVFVPAPSLTELVPVLHWEPWADDDGTVCDSYHAVHAPDAVAEREVYEGDGDENEQ